MKNFKNIKEIDLGCKEKINLDNQTEEKNDPTSNNLKYLSKIEKSFSCNLKTLKCR